MNETAPSDGNPPAAAAGPDQTYRDAMRALIAERWAEVWRAVPVALAGADIEGVHDVRVASRRLRAAMDVAVECFPPSWYRPLHRTAKEITRALGEVRDRDVLLHALIAERDQVPPPERPGITRLIDRIERERVAARADMESFLRQLMDGELADQLGARFGASAGPPAGDLDGSDRDAGGAHGDGL